MLLAFIRNIFFTVISIGLLASLQIVCIETLKTLSIIFSGVTCLISLDWLWILFDFSTNQFQFVKEHIIISSFDFFIGLDGISLFFVILTTIITPISIISNWRSISDNIISFITIILLLEMLLLIIFLVLDILLFYIFFESILPPLFILIGLFGSYDRVRAGFYLFLYTLLGSLFLLLSILSINSIMDTTDFETLYKSNFDYLLQLLLFYGIFIAFAVKTPTIFLNTWLLRAHVESPLSGSIILAGIVLKLSLYGIMRLILGIIPKASIWCTYIIFFIAIITILYASLSTIRTLDVKELIAYSSVSHAAVYLLGVFSNTIQGIEGSILLGVGHGFVSPGLFICAGGVLYDRLSTRLISFYRGMTQTMPLFAILFFILSLGNCGAPLTLNFTGEFMSLYGSFERLPLLGIFASSSIVFSAAYTIYMYNRISFGGVLSRFITVNIFDLNKREFNLLLTLVILTVFLGVYTVPLLDGLHYSVSSLIYLFDANYISCEGPRVWISYFNHNSTEYLNIGLYFSLIMANKYLVLVTILISLFVLSLLRLIFSYLYKYNSYLTILYLGICLRIDLYVDKILYNPFAFVFWTRFFLGITVILYDFLSINGYLGDFLFISVLEDNIRNFFKLKSEDIYNVYSFIFSIENESLLAMSNYDSYEGSYISLSHDKSNIYCASNNSDSGLPRDNGSSPQQDISQQSTTQANSEQSTRQTSTQQSTTQSSSQQNTSQTDSQGITSTSSEQYTSQQNSSTHGLHSVTGDRPQQLGTQQGMLRHFFDAFGYCPHTRLINEQASAEDFAMGRNYNCANRMAIEHKIASRVGDNYFSCNLCRSAICRVCAPTKDEWSYWSRG